jgi:hypothetical protein
LSCVALLWRRYRQGTDPSTVVPALRSCGRSSCHPGSLEFLEVSRAARAHHRGRIPCCICVDNDVWSTDNVPVVLRFLELSRARVGLKRRVGSVSCGAARRKVWSRRWLKRTFVTCPRDSPRDSPHDHDRLPRLIKRWLRTRLSDDGSIASRPNHDQVVGVNGEAEWPRDSSSFSDQACSTLVDRLRGCQVAFCR